MSFLNFTRLARVSSRVPFIRSAPAKYTRVTVVTIRHSSTQPLYVLEAGVPDSIAIVNLEDKKEFTYDDLIKRSSALAAQLKKMNGGARLNEARVAYLSTPNFDYVVMKVAVWLAGGVAVPLCTKHPVSELQYVLKDSGAQVAIANDEYAETITKAVNGSSTKIQIVNPSRDEPDSRVRPLSLVDMNQRAMIIYTSGTTGPPKGVVYTHEMIRAQLQMLSNAWCWTSEDRVLNVLPLHHVHGVLNLLCTSLYVGATLEMADGFSAPKVWDRFTSDPPLTIFSAVPTVYWRLMKEYDSQPKEVQEKYTAGCENFRVMMCGSAALPDPIMHRWKEISHQLLLERYGMTECGMALTNPLHEKREIGHVGLPFPELTVKIVPEGEEGEVNPHLHNVDIAGSLRLKGPTVFTEYWGKPERETAKEFDDDGFLITGDSAHYDTSVGSYAIQGRDSVDIIKVGGYKISAIDVEHVLLAHPSIGTVSVLGVDDEEYGQRLVAVASLNPGKEVTLSELRDFARKKIAPYKLPSELKILSEIPTNPMGKINKKQLVKDLF